MAGLKRWTVNPTRCQLPRATLAFPVLTNAPLTLGHPSVLTKRPFLLLRTNETLQLGLRWKEVPSTRREGTCSVRRRSLTHGESLPHRAAVILVLKGRDPAGQAVTFDKHSQSAQPGSLSTQA